MWQPYIDMVKEYLPAATLVFDKFHITQHLNKAVDEVRRDEARELKKSNPELLKHTRYIWEYQHKGWAKRFHNKWFWWATHSRLKPMRDFAWMLRNHQENILTYFDQRITNGAVEGMNNKAKVVSHRCYGFRTAKNYITALYHCLGNLPEPKCVHRFL